MFENSKRDSEGDVSSIEGVSIHHSTGWGINIVNSQNIILKNINIFGAV
jgi:pectate lyase